MSGRFVSHFSSGDPFHIDKDPVLVHTYDGTVTLLHSSRIASTVARPRARRPRRRSWATSPARVRPVAGRPRGVVVSGVSDGSPIGIRQSRFEPARRSLCRGIRSEMGTYRTRTHVSPTEHPRRHSPAVPRAVSWRPEARKVSPETAGETKTGPPALARHSTPRRGQRVAQFRPVEQDRRRSLAPRRARVWRPCFTAAGRLIGPQRPWDHPVAVRVNPPWPVPLRRCAGGEGREARVAHSHTAHRRRRRRTRACVFMCVSACACERQPCRARPGWRAAAARSGAT